MRFILPTLILGFGLGESAFAFSPDFHLGFESSFSRNVVTPAFFPILKTGFEENSENSKMDLELKMSVEHPKANALSTKNFYYEDSSLHLTLGRKWMDWSELDETWGLGAFNPLDSWDRLRSFSQGLSGIFYTLENPTLHLDLFASYLMLPEITPNVVIENQRFESYHPQAVSSGPQTFKLLNHATPLGYNILIPSYSKILLRPSFAFSLHTKKNLEPFFAKLSIGHLPLNYFPIALQGYYGLTIDQAVVTLIPRLLSHTLINAEMNCNLNEEWSTGLSLLIDQISNEDPIPADYTTATLGTTTYWSPWLQFKNFKLAYLYSQGGFGADVGLHAFAGQNIFNSRILYRNAAQLQMKIEEFTAKILHEFSVDANWLALDWNHSWNNRWNTFVGGDVISAEKNNAFDRGAEFLSDLRALDRLRVGINYVF